MLKKINIGVDNGNKNTKTAHFVFNSGLAEFDQEPVLDKDWLLYDNKYYCLSNERIGYTQDKTKDNRFFVLTLFAIAKELIVREIEHIEVNVNLAVGLPPEHLSSLSQKYQEFFLRNNVIFMYAGKEFVVNIINVTVLPQGYSAAIKTLENKPELNRYPVLYLVDIGGRTVDILELNSGKINIATCQSREDGIISIYNAIKKAMRGQGIPIGEDVIDSILLGKLDGVFLNSNQIQLVKETAQKHVNKLLATIAEENYDLKSNFTIFIGGGALSLKPFLKQSNHIGKCIFRDDLRGNAKGYEIMLSKLGK